MPREEAAPVQPDPDSLGASIPAPGEAPWWLRPATATGVAQKSWPFPAPTMDGDGDRL